MDMLEILKEVLEGKKPNARILADWIEDNCSSHPEFARYHALLHQPDTLRMQTILDVIVKFGHKKQRSLAMKIIRTAMRSRDRRHNKGTIRAYMKKRWSLTRKWYMTEKISHALGTGAVTSPPSSEGS
jgi:hypothetical protein